MTEHPFDQYLDGLKAFQKGDKEKSAREVTKALGGEKPTHPIRSSLKKIFKQGTLLHSVVLDTLVAEHRRRRHGGRKPLQKHQKAG